MIKQNKESVKYPREKIMNSEHILERIRTQYTDLTRAQWIAMCYFSSATYFRIIGDNDRPFSVSALQLASMSRITGLTVFQLMELIGIKTDDLPKINKKKHEQLIAV